MMLVRYLLAASPSDGKRGRRARRSPAGQRTRRRHQAAHRRSHGRGVLPRGDRRDAVRAAVRQPDAADRRAAGDGGGARGILLGPTAFGAIDPGLQATIFSSDIVPYIGVAANLGLVFYMFLIGLEVDFTQLRGRVRMTFAVSNTRC